ncbi:MAG: hypothetical protein GY835_28035 [bacterium]|nr:hypothetical protein [bacterium]
MINTAMESSECKEGGLNGSQCKAYRRDGHRCQARARRGTDLCSFHDPTRKQVIAEGRKKGSTTAVINRICGLDRLPLRTSNDLLNAIEDALAIVRQGGVTADRLALLQLQAVREARELMKMTNPTQRDDPGAHRIAVLDFLQSIREKKAAEASSGIPQE